MKYSWAAARGISANHGSKAIPVEQGRETLDRSDWRRIALFTH